ncbi:hypothetical protein [Nostoc sp. UHCC 0252]|uniref:hypothetical protein n=1 Tax=Nostoc sp. UHCC 0252 TaxID=3110241 RepID=UPI002B2008D3|nr:hypothetical protein [Nostoc sp. UHCC 0252]MEA5605474.1 hypothetical protein [Nostoc sp. UHCC 0252]
MTDREILKEILEIQRQLINNLMLQASLPDQHIYYSPVLLKVDELIEKVAQE